MDVERETVVEIAASGAAVALFVVVIVAIGTTYSAGDDLTSQGALALVGAITGFVFVMALVGYFLSGR